MAAQGSSVFRAIGGGRCRGVMANEEPIVDSNAGLCPLFSRHVGHRIRDLLALRHRRDQGWQFVRSDAVRPGSDPVAAADRCREFKMTRFKGCATKLQASVRRVLTKF
jgi:hypothetical protein